MAEQDEYFYLQPSFDLSSLTVPRIRSILVAHNVAYPSSAKKQELLDILQVEVIPKAKRLLSAQARVKRTSRGITDVPSSQEDGNDEEDSQHMPPPPAPKTPRSRKSKSNLREVDGSTAATPRTARKSKTPSGKRSFKARLSDTETEGDLVPASARRTRKSTPGEVVAGQPSVRIDVPTPAASRRSLAAADSPFSDDNPFQSGSSPPSGGSKRISSTSRNRKSLGESSRKSSSKRRETSSPEIKREESTRSRSVYEVPVSRIGIDRNGVESTEEFTAEAEEELKHDLASDRQLARKRTSALTRHQRRPVSTAAKAAPIAVLTMVLAAVGGWYRQEKINIGYCGVGEPSWSLASNANIPAWVHENLQPQCEPCPGHAICHSNMEAQCETDFILQPHPLSFNDLIPLAPTCEPDSEKERRVKAVADRAVEELRQQRARYECGGDDAIGSSTQSGSFEATAATSQTLVIDTSKPEVPVEALKETVTKQRRKGMSDAEFEDLWKGALEDMIARDEIKVVQDGSGRTSLSSDSLARLPFSCAIRRSLIQSISRARLPISIVILALSAIAYGRHRVVTYTRAKSQVPGLVSMTLDRLATQAALKEEGRAQEGFISVGQLRDDVLRNVFSVRERERVWERVRKVVESNSNVRAATREGGKTGEWSRVWEWIGPVDFAPGLPSRRTSGMIADSPDARPTGDQRQVAEVRRWNEGQAYY